MNIYRNRRQILCCLIDSATKAKIGSKGKGGCKSSITSDANISGKYDDFYFSIALRGKLLEEKTDRNGIKRYIPTERGTNYRKTFEESEKLFEPFSDIEKMLKDELK
jgi:hypothetical protein